MEERITFEDFMKVDIRVATVIQAKPLPKARKPAYTLLLDVGEEIGQKKSSAQLTQLYQPEDLIGKQVLCVVNFPPRQIGTFLSEVLVLATYSPQGTVLIEPEQKVANGDRLG